MHCQKAGIPFRPQKLLATSRGRGSRVRGRGLGHETEEVVRKSFASEAIFFLDKLMIDIREHIAF